MTERAGRPLARISSRSLFCRQSRRTKSACRGTGGRVVNRSHTNTVALLGGTIDPVDHRRSQAPFERLRLARPVRVSASNHHRTISTRHRDQFLWVWFPPLDIQHTVSDVLKIDE